MEKVLNLRKNNLKARKVKVLAIRSGFKSGKKSLRFSFGVPQQLSGFFSRLKTNIWVRIIILSLLVPTAVFHALSAENTIAVFGDTESSENNPYTTSSLDFVLDDTSWSPIENITDLSPGESISKNIKVIDYNGVGFTFFAQSAKASGSFDEFCDALHLKVSLEGAEIFDAGLLYFKSSNLTFGPDTDEWTFEVYLPDGSPNLSGQTCKFNLNFYGWQKEFGGTETGYNDMETSDGYVQTPGEVLGDFIIDSQALIAPEITPEATPTATPEPTPDPSVSPEPSNTPEPTPTPEASPEITPEATPTPSPEITPEPTPTETIV